MNLHVILLKKKKRKTVVTTNKSCNNEERLTVRTKTSKLHVSIALMPTFSLNREPLGMNKVVAANESPAWYSRSRVSADQTRINCWT